MTAQHLPLWWRRLHALDPHPDTHREYTRPRPWEDTHLERRIAHNQVLAILDPERLRAARGAEKHLQ